MKNSENNRVAFAFDDNPVVVMGRKSCDNENGWFLSDGDNEAICFIRTCDYKFSHFIIYPNVKDGTTTCFYFTRIGKG